jgi:hypothetical protein
MPGKKKKKMDTQAAIAIFILAAAAAYAVFRIWKLVAAKKDMGGNCGPCKGCWLRKNVFYSCSGKDTQL